MKNKKENWISKAAHNRAKKFLLAIIEQHAKETKEQAARSDRLSQFADSLSGELERERKRNADLAANLQAVQSDRQAMLDEMTASHAENESLSIERNAAVREARELRAAFRAMRSLVWQAMTDRSER